MEAISEGGLTVSLKGGNSDYRLLLARMHKISIDNGIYPGLSAYQVTQAALHNEPAMFYPKMFGCWTIGKKDAYPRIDYDGRDFLLMVSEKEGSYSFQCKIDDLKHEKNQYFKVLLRLAGWDT